MKWRRRPVSVPTLPSIRIVLARDPQSRRRCGQGEAPKARFPVWKRSRLTGALSEVELGGQHLSSSYSKQVCLAGATIGPQDPQMARAVSVGGAIVPRRSVRNPRLPMPGFLGRRAKFSLCIFLTGP